jgi:hypothetical protein
MRWFTDAGGGDLHLTAGASVAIDQGMPLDDAGLDLDGEPHTSGAPDLGCDERGSRVDSERASEH